MTEYNRIDYFSYEELSLLGGTDLPLINFEMFQPSDFKEAKDSLEEKLLITKDGELTDTGFKIATLVREYISAIVNIRINDMYFAPFSLEENEFILISRFKNNGFQIRIIANDIAWWSIIDQYPILMREESSDDWDFRSIDDETLVYLNNQSIDTINRLLEIEIYNHETTQKHYIYNIYEQNEMLFIRYPLKEQIFNVHVGVINTFILELFGLDKDSLQTNVGGVN